MATNSFSHLLPNLFIGLCKGSRLLHPYSAQFKSELGYAIFKTDILAIPPSAVNTYNAILIVQPTALESFKAFLGARGWRFPVIVFNTQEGAYSLKKAENAFGEKKTDEFFTSGVEVQRIPLHYLAFSLDQISPSNIVAFVARHLISLLVKGAPEISIEEFCAGYIPVWGFIDISKRNELLKVSPQLPVGSADILSAVRMTALRFSTED